jgi:hypothetical protein
MFSSFWPKIVRLIFGENGVTSVPKFSCPTAQALPIPALRQAPGRLFAKDREGQATLGVADGSEIKCLDHTAVHRMENSWL